MEKQCVECGKGFDISDQDIAFCKRINVPSPILCPQDRQRKRLAWRNEWNLYRRKCDKTNKFIISSYPQDSPFPVYEYDEWWADNWTAFDYGQKFDFGRPFFEQFRELIQKVPRMNLSSGHNENCDYVNYSNYSKDCYLIFGCHASEKCIFSWRVHRSLGCYDCAQLESCKYCYECVDCENCYELYFGRNCENCSESWYLYNCLSCKDCFLCCNLIHKRYHILNRKYSKDDYEKKVAELKKLAPSNLWQKFDELKLESPHKALNVINCQNCSGDYLVNCKNCDHVFTARECEDCKYLYIGEHTTDCLDCDIVGWPAELCYESIGTCVKAYANFFSSFSWSCSNIYYCDSCFSSSNLFGCIGLRRNKYCILNKQYSEDEYNKLVLRIIEHMKQTGEYGEFFPSEMSPFLYTDTVANDYFPLKS